MPQLDEGAVPEDGDLTCYDRYAPSIFAYLYRQISSHQDAEDLLLEVFMAAFQHEPFRALESERQIAWLKGKVSQRTSDTYIAPAKRGNRLIGDMLYADQVSRYLLSQGQFTQLNQSQMVDGYQVTLDRAYSDANILILGIYAVMPLHWKKWSSRAPAERARLTSKTFHSPELLTML